MRLSTEEISDSSPPSPPPPISRRSKHRHRRPPISPSPSPSPHAETSSINPDQSSNPDNSETDIPSSENSIPLTSSSYYYSSPIPPTYINVAPLPVFRGTSPDDCPVAHLSRFERVARANNAASSPSTMLRIFPATLDGEAALWYELAVEPFPDITWDETKFSFLDFFRRPEFVDKARTDLMTIKQGEDETVNAFYLRMQWILKKWPDHGLPDSLLKGIFVDGLREDFQDWIVPQWPESLEEAVGLATGWEQAQSVRARKRMCGFCEGRHEESGCEVRRKMKEMWRKTKEEEEEVGGSEESKKEEGVGRVVSFGSRRMQCQCWKHQCWRKLERGNSVVSEKNVNVE